jgi:hypothetical protein
MRPPRKKSRPHPRSLDALFPRPKKPPVKRCPAGHSQSQRWKPGDACLTCSLDLERRLRAELAALEGAAEREEWRRRNGPVPAVLEMRVVDTGRIIRYAIPPHLQAQKRAQLKRRGRRRRGRI